MVIALLAIIEIGTTRARDLPTNNNGGTLTDQNLWSFSLEARWPYLASACQLEEDQGYLVSVEVTRGLLLCGLGGSTGGNNFFGPPSTTSP
uniref:Secreted protein n=1 Tax=Cannabis sativa TaxID=3483 RepID=A0A803PGB4_CANSA